VRETKRRKKKIGGGCLKRVIFENKIIFGSHQAPPKIRMVAENHVQC
jgi:hypothetical protein